mmetsp:Transcript_8283/g.13412  ORF Transcript_8283/g.13412 Transcript_8283/m.13412 type:complete len:268 (-) Transcript_8283:37-840(-)|eukprot:CAMPEP_0203769928 /NCGR_PEP_ID=MMETSP0099_2-20121227/2493_1 /ASSEMBLY_ACC=CAM_ASM_000209 /TAXON_ID=96639 /ORGANISM=" , Strain NY0313808BC1" /LENGTH=267 /DNA_ID=CAMNT_0050666939 /DNA_START=218 /DNA_END=1021 /DNA_ORIENTATION=+
MSSKSSFVQDVFNLQDVAAVITGGSSGFGEHFARVYAKAGVKHIALLARRTDKLEKISAELCSQYPGVRVVCAKCDVSNVASISKAFDNIEEQAGVTFNVIVNNAGIGPVHSVLDETEETYNQVMNVNLRGCYFVAQEAAKRLRSKKMGGSIINISSIFGMRVGYGHSVYSMSKAGLDQLTKAMSLELLKFGIRVNSINPGFFRTEMTAEYYDSPKGDAYLKKHVPLQRLGNLSEIDGALLLLSSSASTFMFGSTVVVDGGHVISSL